ncbi:MAG TPA: SAM-dependent methyltransferase [Streptosporangiaceae bacterium]|nr:SAM-dependent methyltransferase [Streptosporangiaceae bacterium]
MAEPAQGPASFEEIPAGIDPTRPSPARMYDYLLGGTHNFQIDRDATERFRAQMPDLEDASWANRGFHGRAAKWMAVSRGIGQFLDIGSGLPTQSNTHEVLHTVAPSARVVYVDNDPMVLVLAKELLSSDGTTAFVHADLRDPDSVLGHPDLRALIDFDEPVGLLMTAVLQFVGDSSDPWGLVRRYCDALAPGSYLALSHITGDKLPPRSVQTGVEIYGKATASAYPRSRAEIERFFDGLELVPPFEGADPALTHVGIWGSEDPQAADTDGSRLLYCGVARRP